MIAITAVTRAKPGRVPVLRAALLEVAAHVAAHGPGTAGFFLSQGRDDPNVFTTHERFVDVAAMEAHNASAAVARFFAQVPSLIGGKAALLRCAEFRAKAPLP